MIRFLLFLFCFITSILVAKEELSDAVHARVSTRVYFTSDFVNLQNAIILRGCELNNSEPSFLKLVKNFYKDQKTNLNLSDKNLADEKLSFKKNELEALIIIIKLIQVLVEQQVSVQKSNPNPISAACSSKARINANVKDWYNKLIFLDDLLALKANIEKDENKKSAALKSILDSLDKQMKHEVMIKLE